MKLLYIDKWHGMRWKCIILLKNAFFKYQKLLNLSELLQKMLNGAKLAPTGFMMSGVWR